MPLGINLLKDSQAFLGQAVGLVCLSFTPGNLGCHIGVFSHPMAASHLLDECFSLVQPLADSFCIAQRHPEPLRRLDEGATDHELVACCAKEQECLLKDGLSSAILAIYADRQRQKEEGHANF